MDPGILVPPIGYGGHERLVALFAQEYVKMGHEVHLLVTSGSKVEGCVMHPFGNVGFPPKKWDARKAILVAWHFLYKHHNEFDLIHNFGRLAYLLPILNKPVKKIMTYGREISNLNIAIVTKLLNKNLVFTAPSDYCVSTGNVAGKWFKVCNAINFKDYKVRESVSKDAPLIFLSRLERLKGAHEAIEVALKTNNRLIIAGNISPLEEEKQYFKECIEPFIDGNQIIYVGALDDFGKNKYLGLSKAMIFPARTKEAFGLVMIEAMACGTPVIAYNLAAMPEVVDEGITGYIVDDINEMIVKIPSIDEINRVNCAARAKVRFDVNIIAKEYLNLI
jgi:glycosyltransferase involved in cell wall biosynthesis